MRCIACRQKSGIACRRNVDLPAPKTVSDRVIYVLIQMESEHNLRSRDFLTMPFQKIRSVSCPEGIDKRPILVHLLEDFGPVVEVVGEGGVNLAQSEMRQPLSDFFRRAAVDFRLNVNVLYANAGSGDESP